MQRKWRCLGRGKNPLHYAQDVEVTELFSLSDTEMQQLAQIEIIEQMLHQSQPVPPVRGACSSPAPNIRSDIQTPSGIPRVRVGSPISSPVRSYLNLFCLTSRSV